ncbi:MAG: lasso peptide biosynthesis B2 protein [Pyrinomonadaceae bacterium]
MANLFSTATRLFLSRPQRAFLILRMAWSVAILCAVVKLVSLPRALSLVSSSSEPSSARPEDQQDLASAIDALLGINMLFLKPICWKRAAILHRYLGMRGIATTINFGLRKDAGPLNGHAWLEAGGRPIFETETPDYAVTYVFPSSTPFAMELASLAKTKLV